LIGFACDGRDVEDDIRAGHLDSSNLIDWIGRRDERNTKTGSSPRSSPKKFSKDEFV